MNILVIGANGQVGSAFESLFANISKKDDHLKDSHFTFVTRCNREPRESSFKYIVNSLGSQEEITRLFHDTTPDIVINCAAYTAVDKAESEVEAARAANSLLPKWLSKECLESKASLVHFSTDYVFEGTGSEPWVEDAPCSPQNVYGITKLEGESYIRQSLQNHLIIRTQWVFAATGHNFVKTMLRLGQSKEKLSVVSDQVGAPTSAAVIAAYTWKLLRLCLKDNKRGHLWGTYHLSAKGFTSWHMFAQEIFRMASSLGFSVVVKDVEAIPTSAYPTPAKRPLNSRLSTSKLEATLGEALPTWQSGLLEVLQTIKSQEKV